MKNWLAPVIITFFVWGCATTPYIQTIKPVIPDQTENPEETQYYGKIANKLDQSIINNDLELDFWQIAILIPLDRYVSLNNDLFNLIIDKQKEYSSTFLPEYKRLLLDGFNKIGVAPKESNLNLLRYEFVFACSGNKDREVIMNQVFNEVYKKKETILDPIFIKAKEISENNYKELSSAVNDNVPFVNSYVNLYNYAKQEKTKLMSLDEINKKYTKYIENDKNKFMNSLTASQKEQLQKSLSSKNNSTMVDFIKNLKSDQILIFNSLIEKGKYAEIVSKNFNQRFEKFATLSKWIEDNKAVAQHSLQQEDTIKAERAERGKAVMSSLLLGVAGGLASYGAYQASRPRPQNVWLYDTKGNYYWGTIR